MATSNAERHQLPTATRGDPQVNAAKMLCECCQAIFSETDPALNYDGQERKPHHKSYAAFVRAALDELCWICNIVMDDLPEDACDASPFQTFWSVAYPTYDTLFISTAKDVKILYGPPGTRTWEDVSGICTRIKLSAAHGLEGHINSPPGLSLQQAGSWYTGCKETHQACTKYRGIGRNGPSRLLYIDCPEDGVKLPRRIWIQKVHSLPAIPKYTTLSHRWGRPAPPKLLRRNESQYHKDGIEFAALPKSFRDAIQITCSVGLRHIWIDSLCIVQSEQGCDQVQDPEWTREIGRMGEIYSGGEFNIAIMDSNDSEGGCMSERKLDLVPVVELQWHRETTNSDDDNHSKLWTLLPPHYSTWTEVFHPNLWDRGWVHQELHLSPATLYWTGKEYCWVCSSELASESYPGGRMAEFVSEFAPERAYSAEEFDEGDYERLPGGIRQIYHLSSLRQHELSPPAHYQLPWYLVEETSRTADNFLVYIWGQIVRQYSGTITTVPEDKVVAVAGMASLLRDWYRNFGGGEHEVHYHSGMWSVGILTQLAWRSKRSIRWKGTSNVPKPLYIPTWSWASLTAYNPGGKRATVGHVEPGPHSVPEFTSVPLARVLSFPSGPGTADDLGRALSADGSELRLRVRRFPITQWIFDTSDDDGGHGDSFECHAKWAGDYHGSNVFFDCQAELDLLTSSRNDANKEYYLVPLKLESHYVSILDDSPDGQDSDWESYGSSHEVCEPDTAEDEEHESDSVDGSFFGPSVEMMRDLREVLEHLESLRYYQTHCKVIGIVIRLEDTSSTTSVDGMRRFVRCAFFETKSARAVEDEVGDGWQEFVAEREMTMDQYISTSLWNTLGLKNLELAVDEITIV